MSIQFTSKKVGELLEEGDLRIPSYQRPYKWNRKHIRNLFYDLRDAMGKKEYQIGSVILHENDGHLDIVDGQQRLISISLFLHSLDDLENYKGANQLLSAAEFGELSCYHASENYNEWKNLTQLVGENEAKDICNFFIRELCCLCDYYAPRTIIRSLSVI